MGLIEAVETVKVPADKDKARVCEVGVNETEKVRENDTVRREAVGLSAGVALHDTDRVTVAVYGSVAVSDTVVVVLWDPLGAGPVCVLLADPDLALVRLQVGEGAGGLRVGDSVVNVGVQDTEAPYDAVSVGELLRDTVREPEREGISDRLAVPVAL